MSTRTSRIIAGVAGFVVVLGVGGGSLALASAAQNATPVPQSTATPSTIDLDDVEFREQEALERDRAAQAAIDEAARVEAERVAAEQAAAAQAEADRIAAEQAQQATPPQAPNPAPAPAPAPEPPAFSCPDGAVDAGDGASCWWEYCFTISVPDPAYPECNGPFRP